MPVSFGGDAEAICMYLQHLQVKHLAIFLYDKRVDYSDLYMSLKQIAPSYNIVLYPFEFGVNPHNETYLLDDAIEGLKESGINYILGYLHDLEMPNYIDENRFVLDRLVDEGLLGKPQAGKPDYFWIFQESLYYQFDVTDPWKFLAMNEKLATAINNTAILTVRGELGTAEYTRLDESVMQLVHDPAFWPYFDSIRQEREMETKRSFPYSFDPLDFWIFHLWYVFPVFHSQQLARITQVL
jgi:hypothetical protein